MMNEGMNQSTAGVWVNKWMDKLMNKWMSEIMDELVGRWTDAPMISIQNLPEAFYKRK